MSKLITIVVAMFASTGLVAGVAAADTQPTPSASAPPVAIPAAQATPATPAAQPAQGASPAAQATATATPSALNIAFDQVDRLIVGAETPPPLNGFALELAAAKDAQTASAGFSPPKGAGIGDMVVSQIPIVGSIISMAHAKQQMAAMKKQQQQMQNSMSGNTWTMSSYAFYKGWSRVETAGSVIITKPDQHLTIFLDAKAKTYRKFDTSATGETQEGSTVAAMATGQATADAMISMSQADQATVEGQPVVGYSTEAIVNLTESNGSCHDGAFRAKRLEYLAQLPEPLPVTKLQSLDSLALPNECTATIHRHIAGTPQPTGQMYVYRVVTVVRDPEAATRQSSSRGAPDPMAMMQHLQAGGAGSTPVNYLKVSERGNIRQLTDADAALFEIPAGYTEDK